MSFLVNKINDLLSVNNGIGETACWKSFLSLMSHIPSADVNAPAMNLDSMEDQDTLCCFLDAHDSGDPLKVNIQLVVDF